MGKIEFITRLRSAFMAAGVAQGKNEDGIAYDYLLALAIWKRVQGRI